MPQSALSIVKREILSNRKLQYFIVFCSALYVFSFLHLPPRFTDPDSFYHTKIAMLMEKQGMVMSFPWLPYTTLNENYTDHHFLYHLALIPFIKLFSPPWGVKIATVLFACLTIIFFYWFLLRIGVRWAGLYAMILLVDSSFVFRINLAKAQGLAISMFFITYYLVIKRKLLYLFIASFFYVWLYGGWPLIIVIAFIDVFSGLPSIFKKHLLSKRWRIDKIMFLQKIRADLALLSTVLFGLMAGLAINPYFPRNLYFYWNQIAKIAIFNSQYTIGVGGEWSAYKPLEFITNSSVALIVCIIAITFFFLNIRKARAITLNLFVATLIFGALMIKSRRNLEYFVPIMIAFSGASITLFFQEHDTKSFFIELREFLRGQKYIFFALVIPVLMIPYIIVRDYYTNLNFYRNGIEFTKYEAPMEWLKENSALGAIVFHSDWDEFPMLFYHNDLNYYIVGLDTRFFYYKNPDLYKKWDEITRGRGVENLYSTIKNDFRAEYVFVDIKRHADMDKNLQNNFKFKEVYKDDSAKVYQVL